MLSVSNYGSNLSSCTVKILIRLRIYFCAVVPNALISTTYICCSNHLNLSLRPLGIFPAFLFSADFFSKTPFSKILFQEYHQIVKQFKSRSGLMQSKMGDFSLLCFTGGEQNGLFGSKQQLSERANTRQQSSDKPPTSQQPSSDKPPTSRQPSYDKPSRQPSWDKPLNSRQPSSDSLVDQG